MSTLPATTSSLVTPTNVVQSNVTLNQSKGNAGYAFRNWHYATAKLRLAAQTATKSATEEQEACFDSGCPVTLADRAFMKSQLGDNMKIQQLASPLSVRGVGGKLVKISDFIVTQLYIDGVDTAKQPATVCITAEVHLVDDLKANMLIGVDVLAPQRMSLNFERYTLTIGSCGGIKAVINPVNRVKPHVKRTIRTQKTFTVQPGELAHVPVTFRGDLPDDRDFLFEPQCAEHLGHDGGVFVHIVDASLSFVQVHNTTDSQVILPRRARLDSMVEYNQQGCYMASPDLAPKAACGWMSDAATKRSWKAKLAAAATVTAAYAVTTTDISSVAGNSVTSSTIDESISSMFIPQIDTNLEHVCPNGVIVYGQPEIAGAISALAAEYQDLFVDKGTIVDIPEQEWMPVNLKPNAVAKPAKVYPLGQRDREVVDSTFDKLHAQGKMHFTSQPTPFSYPVFVVWRETSEGRKGRAVVDIRGLNDITEADTYPLPLQGDVIASVAGFPFISTVDAVG